MAVIKSPISLNRKTHEKSFMEKRHFSLFDFSLKHSFLRQIISDLCGHYTQIRVCLTESDCCPILTDTGPCQQVSTKISIKFNEKMLAGFRRV
jgi:hypothetical protein